MPDCSCISKKLFSNRGGLWLCRSKSKWQI